MSRNVEGVAGQDSMYGSLTNSLICPNAVQFPPTPEQGWQGPMGWQQNNGTIENRYTNYYPGHMLGATPNYMYSERDLVTYDEGNEDFYENRQRWVPHEEPEAQVIEHNKGVQETRSEAITPSSGGTSIMQQPNAPMGFHDTRKENQKPTDKNSRSATSIAPSDRAAELRAKLLAVRSANGNTPGPELKSKKDTRVTEYGATSASNGSKAESELKADSDSGKGGLGISAKPNGEQKSSERFNQRDSSADIEGLFAEARAAAEAQTLAGHTDRKEMNGGGNANISSAKKGSLSKPELARRPSLNNSVKSLEASEQGEIREATSDSGQARHASEAEKPKRSEIAGKVVKPDKPGHSTAVASNTAQQKKYIDTDLANGVRDRPSPSSARPRPESKSSRKASADTQSQPKTGVQRRQEDRLTHAERSSRPDRDLHVSPRDGERERERKAAEYKRELASSRQRLAGVQGAPDQDAEDPRRSRQNAVSDTKVLETRPDEKGTHVAQEPAAEERNEDLEDWLQMTGYYDYAYRKKALDRHRKLIALDKQKAELEREAQLEYEERTQIARAQSVLPRESIERDISRVVYSPKIVRASSVAIMPPPPVPIKQNGDTVGLRIKDLAARETSSSGRRIEVEHRPGKHVDALAPVEVSNLKRHHVADDRELEELQPADKLIRLDLKGRANPRAEVEQDRVPVRASSISLERRITLDDSEWSSRNGFREHISRNNELDRRPRQVRGRPVSPYTAVDRQPLRSLSPISRRTSGQDTYMTDRRYSDDFNTERVSRSPGQVILSRGSSPPRRTQSIRYEEYRDEPPLRRYYEDKIKAEPKHRAYPEYQDYFPGRAYDTHKYASSRGRAGNRGRGGYYSGRGGYKALKREEEHDGNNFQSQSVDLRAGDSRFFLIKSWNYDNVLAAQRDETWVTQEKNLDILVDAFKTCRNVILAFSVNKSVAFQGYARMESLPGTVEKPTWARELHWATSPPFRIRWLTTAETHSSRVHHLKNALNENQGVHVGRDGQEIEEQCGVALCEVMDEEERKMRLVDESY